MLGSVRIIVVEDDPALSRALQGHLRSLGHTDCPCARTEAEAVDLAERFKPDLVLMDVSLEAGGDGARAAAEIRQRWGIPSIFLTAHADDETLERCKKAEPAGYLLKPFTAQMLRVTLEMALHRERALKDRERAEQERRRAESLFVAILENAPIAILAAAEGKVVSSNQSASALLGYSGAALRGLSIHQLLQVLRDPLEPDARYQAIAQLASGEEIPVLVRRAQFAFDGEQLTNYFVQDLRERLALERQLIQAQSSQAVSRLASGVAHDFNNLLGALQTLLFLVETESRGASTPPIKDLERAIERGGWLAQQLAQLGKYADREPELIDLGQYVQAMEQLFQRLLSREITFDVTCTSDPTLIRIATAVLQHLLLTLLLNAQESMPDGGTLSIRVSVVGAFARVELEDSGHGMTPEVLAQAFEPFFTTKQQGTATGLGLPTVKRSIEALGGSVELQSRPSIGTLATLLFPLARTEQES